MEIGDKIWKIGTRWDYFAKDTVGKQMVKAVFYITRNVGSHLDGLLLKSFFALSKAFFEPHLFPYAQNIIFIGRKRIVADIRAGPGIGKGAVAGHLAVIAFAAAGSKRLAAVDYLIKFIW